MRPPIQITVPAEILRKRLKLSKIEYYETHLALISSLFPPEDRATPMETKVLATFMSLEGDIIRHRFGFAGRSIVKEKLKLSAASMTNYLTFLENKGYLVKDSATNELSLLPLLAIEQKEQYYLFKLEIVPENEHTDNITTEHAASSPEATG